jgi:hypothetical protein
MRLGCVCTNGSESSVVAPGDIQGNPTHIAPPGGRPMGNLLLRACLHIGRSARGHPWGVVASKP